MDVWYKLDDRETTRLSIPVEDGATVNDLKKAIKDDWANRLASVDAPDLKVFAPGADPSSSRLQSDDSIPTATTCQNPLIVVAPQQDGAQNSPKKQKTEATKDPFENENYDFEAIVNFSINNQSDTILYERDHVKQQVLLATKRSDASQKAQCVTLWSGRGSGKTSLLRWIALHSEELKQQRKCGRIMVVDGKAFEEFVEKFKRTEALIEKVLPVLVALHLCMVFGDSSMEKVDFASNATFMSLWHQEKYLPSTLLNKLEQVVDGKQAFQWWRECTKDMVESGNPSPIILLDTAEVLSEENEKPPSPQKPKESGEAPSWNGQTPDRVHPPPAASPSTPRNHLSRPNAKYLLLEWLMIQMPSDSSMIAFGTGATRFHPRPQNFQSHVNHVPVEPLNALTEESALQLFLKMKNKKVDTLNELEKRHVRTVFAVSAGIPRMLVSAFETEGNLMSTVHETWEAKVREVYYKDASDLVSENDLSPQCLAKAILICAVSNVELIEHRKIPTEEMTWDELRWRSIVFLSAAEPQTQGEHEPQTKEEQMKRKGHLRIPRLLWGGESETHKKLRTWVSDNCHFALDELLPTVYSLYKAAGEASATASGRLWEKMFASALVARFFVHCWKEGEDPAAHFVSLHQLLPQKNEADNSVLKQVEVCLSNGVKSCSSEAFAVENPEDGFDWNAIHANWNMQSAHHDMILPVRNVKSKKRDLWAVVSARNGNRKAESELERSKQHLVSKQDEKEVAGLIRAVNPRGTTLPNRRMAGTFYKMEKEKRYAEVSITEGHVPHVLCLLSMISFHSGGGDGVNLIWALQAMNTRSSRSE